LGEQEGRECFAGTDDDSANVGWVLGVWDVGGGHERELVQMNFGRLERVNFRMEKTLEKKRGQDAFLRDGLVGTRFARFILK
jgi:hypothetical protein